jgi:TRAP-type C4-dicarboxylate transport system permease small subunit
MNAILDASETWLRRAALAAAAAGGFAMLVMFGVIAANIALRPFGASLRGTVEISGYLCALAVGLCMPAAQAAGSHIAAGIWASSLPRPVRLLQKGASGLICSSLLALVARELFGIAEYAREMGEYIEGVGVSSWGMAAGLALGASLHAAIFAHAALRAVFPAGKNNKGGAA